VCRNEKSSGYPGLQVFHSMHFLCVPRTLYTTVKVKQSHYRPGQAPSVPGSCGSRILRQSAHEVGKVVSARHRPPLPSGNILISVRG
jgi:hypothetical protein